MDQFGQTIGLGIGWLLVGWVAVQALSFTWKTVRRRAQWRREYAREKAEFGRRIEVTAQAARASKAIPDWTGWRPFRVAAIVDEAHDVKSFYFTPVDGLPLARFAPGQYLTFRLPASDAAKPVVRCYSLSDRPREDYYRSTLKRLSAPPERPELPAGRGSSFFHDRVQVGDVLAVRAPAGTFLIDALASEPIVLIGAGIGITPLVSMLEAIIHTGKPRELYAIFGFRNGREHPFKERLTRLAETLPQLQIHISYSAPTPQDVQYRDYSHRGRVTIERVRAVLPASNYRFYVCGPGPMMKSLVPALRDWGVPKSHVHFEAFGPASVKSACARSVAQVATACEVRFERSNRALQWDGAFGSLLELGEAAGIAMPSGCRAGSCGECMMVVRGGSTTSIKKPGITVPAGHCLTCISIPQCNIALDA